jgi:hypothetical protein
MRSDIYVESVLAKCETLKKSGLWAPEPRLRPSAWVANFTEENDRVLAAAILDNFIFYSDRACDRLLMSAYHQLEDAILVGHIPCPSRPEQFIQNMAFAPVEGEDPRPTDSGNPMCRRLRDLTGIPDRQFHQPHLLLAEARAGKPIVLVDDFLGSGQQLIQTWQRPYVGAGPQSLQDLHATSPFPAFCLVPVATETALRNVRAQAPALTVIATHVLDDGYSVRNLASPHLNPPMPDFQARLRDFLSRHAASLDLETFLQTGDRPLYGFHELGLLLSFEHGTPDSTVPLLWAGGPTGWIRLVRYA